MLRYYIVVGEGVPMHLFTDYKVPNDVYKYLEDNTEKVLGEEMTVTSLQPSELININDKVYMHVTSRKFYKKEEERCLIVPVCELCFLQEYTK
jgi:hypothetical protein